MKKRKAVTVDTDRVMKQLYLALAEDFSNIYGPDFCRRSVNALLDGIPSFRDYTWPSRSMVPPHMFKAQYQLESLFKRYRFKDDSFTDAQLKELAIRKFRETQVRCAHPLGLRAVDFPVLREARRICTRILGEYDVEEHMSLCRFGKRACLGVPYADSYLDTKLLLPLDPDESTAKRRFYTGSAEHVDWIVKCCEKDHILAETLGMKGITYVEKTNGYRAFLKHVHITDCIRHALVPKSYKSLRGMMPDTLFGSYYTAGLGRVIQDRLKTEGLNIRRLQEKHRKLVEKASRTRHLVTADLSAASDSITLGLLRRVLPVKWYRAVTHGRSRYAELDGARILLSSTVTMGLGTTFPLQTLIFYSIISAIGKLVGGSFYVSVYGDDLIYSRHLHRYVAEIFPRLHLILNGDKTYVEDYFRESCGSDFYRGVDVRPFQPEGEHRRIGGPLLASFLYRTYNGLKRRWEGVEIPTALDLLERLLILHSGEVYQVPPTFPDGSGIRVSKPCAREFYSPVGYAPTSCCWVFKYLHVTADKRTVISQMPYYWEKLRSSTTEPESHVNPFDFWETKDALESWVDETDVPQLVWVKSNPPRYIRSRVTGRRLRLTVACVAKKASARYLVQQASTSCWT